MFVGNFGDGSINAFDFDSGEFLGTVGDASSKPINIPGVWALQFGLGVAGATSDALFFTAGIADEKHGLFGTLTVNPSSLAQPEGPAMVDPKLRVTTVVRRRAVREDRYRSMNVMYVTLNTPKGRFRYELNTLERVAEISHHSQSLRIVAFSDYRVQDIKNLIRNVESRPTPHSPQDCRALRKATRASGATAQHLDSWGYYSRLDPVSLPGRLANQ